MLDEVASLYTYQRQQQDTGKRHQLSIATSPLVGRGSRYPSSCQALKCNLEPPQTIVPRPCFLP